MTHTMEFDNRDDAYDFLDNISQSNASEFIEIDEAGECKVVAKYPGGRFERTIIVDEVEFVTGYVGNHIVGFEETTKTGFQVELDEIEEHEEESALRNLFESWKPVFGGQK